jgi:hypothetical protein
LPRQAAIGEKGVVEGGADPGLRHTIDQQQAVEEPSTVHRFVIAISWDATIVLDLLVLRSNFLPGKLCTSVTIYVDFCKNFSLD